VLRTRAKKPRTRGASSLRKTARRRRLAGVDGKTIATVGASVLVAFAGFVAAYVNNLRLARRKDRLDRVSRQLSEFYGPLLSLVSTGNATWGVFRQTYRPGRPFWGTEPAPTEEEAATWRLWMREVFMPLNRQIASVIHSKADLLDEEEMPQCLLDVCAHVASYEPVLKRWEEGDVEQHTALNAFPRRDLSAYASASFLRLKHEQSRLLASSRRRA